MVELFVCENLKIAMVSISWALVASLSGEPLTAFFPPVPPPSPPTSYIGLSKSTPSPADTALGERELVRVEMVGVAYRAVEL